jgi:hypothetical protein
MYRHLAILKMIWNIFGLQALFSLAEFSRGWNFKENGTKKIGFLVAKFRN